MESYTRTGRRPTTNRSSGGRATVTVIGAAKEKVTTLHLAEHLAAGQGKQLRRAGRELLTNCLLADHEDRTPSFYVDPEKDLFYCHGCLRGGDVVRLAQLAWQIERADVAAAEVLMTFGHEIPKRPPSWFAKFERQRPVRDAIGKARFEHLRRRLYRLYFRPLVEAEGHLDEKDRRHDEQVLWEATAFLARHVLSGAMGRRDG